MIDYDKAIVNINKPLLEINKDIEYYENRIKDLVVKRNYIRNKKAKSKNIINKIISGETQSPIKKQKLTTKHPENINNRITNLNLRIIELDKEIKILNSILDKNFRDKYNYPNNINNFREINDEVYKYSCEAEDKMWLEKSLYNHKTKLNRYLQIRNKLDKGE